MSVFRRQGAFLGNAGPFPADNDKGRAFLAADGGWVAPMVLHGVAQDEADAENERLLKGGWGELWLSAGVTLAIAVWVEHDPVEEARAGVAKAAEIEAAHRLAENSVPVVVNAEIPYKVDGGDPTGQKSVGYCAEFVRLAPSRPRAVCPIGFGWHKPETNEYFPTGFPFDPWRESDFALLPQAYHDPQGGPGTPFDLTWVMRANALVYPADRIHPMLGAYGHAPPPEVWRDQLKAARAFGFQGGWSVFNAENMEPRNWAVVHEADAEPFERVEPVRDTKPETPARALARAAAAKTRDAIRTAVQEWEGALPSPAPKSRITVVGRIMRLSDDQWSAVRDRIIGALDEAPG